jgi:hypothetical protein
MIFGFIGIDSFMSYQTQELLKAIRIESDDWQGAVHEQIESGRNFFLILPEGEDALKRFCHSFHLQGDCLQGRFNRSDLLRMGQYVDGGAFDEMLVAWDADDLVVFVEQIDFPLNRPPHVKPFIVYSPLWGILSQHDDVRVARTWLEDSEQWDRTRLSQPHVYQWTNDAWKML